LTYNPTNGNLSISDGNVVNIPVVTDTDNQSLTYNPTNGNLSISDGNVVNIPVVTNTDNQSLNYDPTSGNLSITGGNLVNIPVSTGTDNQSLSYDPDNGNLSISRGNVVNIPRNTDNQVLVYDPNSGQLSISGGNVVTLPSNGGNSPSSSWVLSGNNIYNANAGNVGIGKLNPQSKLDVVDVLASNEEETISISTTSSSSANHLRAVDVEVTASNNTASVNGLTSSINGSNNEWVRGLYGSAGTATVTSRGVQGYSAGTMGANFGTTGFAEGNGNGTNTGAFGSANNSTFRNVGLRGVAQGPVQSAKIGVEAAAYGNNAAGESVLGATLLATSSGGSAVGLRSEVSDNAQTSIGIDVLAFNNRGLSVGIRSTAERAGIFDGDVLIYGDLNVTGNLGKASGTFKIDHPLDPGNKYLVHSFVESPDMMNIYNGNTVTDAQGLAVVQLPDYFNAANKDFRYQLTTIGSFAKVMVKQKISDNQFVIQSDEPNVEVSWQVTGVRADKWANANRINPEVPKEKPDTYLHPEVFGQPLSKDVKFEMTEELNKSLDGPKQSRKKSDPRAIRAER
ncbi:MAG: hypothetical protein AAFV25_22190, partial [Bacteroidota bacterium]